MKLKLKVISTAILIALAVPSVSMAEVAVPSSNMMRIRMPVQGELKPLNWDNFNRAKLEEMINQYGKHSPNYDPKKPPYAVFDFDNTTIFLDIGEATFTYQIENLVFGMTPKQMNEAIRKNISNKNFDDGHKNAAGQSINIDLIAPDIVENYTWLYNNYKGLNGKKSLEEVKQSPHYMAFASKLRYLYEAIGDTFDHATSYPWVTYQFTGMTEQEVRDVTAKAMRWQQGQPVGEVRWTTPASMPGKAGILSIDWKNGARTIPEVQNLYQVLRDNGFDIWICSASFVDVIKEMGSNPEFGYNVPVDHVLAMELERDSKGRIKTEFKKGFDQTQGKGKTTTIERFLVSKYGYGPTLVAGDSEGDQNMIADFKDTKIGLIFNRLRSPDTDIGKFSKQAVETYGKGNARYLLQGRNDNTGLLVPSQSSFKLGSDKAQTLK